MSFMKDIFTNFNAVNSAYGGIEDKARNSELPAEIETVVIGGGLSGLSTAIDLAEAGRDVIVLEARNVADGPSGRSGGQLWPGFEQAYSEMAQKHGHNLVRGIWQMTHEALRTVYQRAATREDKCDFRPGVLVVAETGPQARWIEEESAIMKKAGFDYVSLITAEEIKRDYLNTDYYLNGMLFRGETEGQQYGHLNPRKLTQTVAGLAVEKGAKLIENTPVQSLSIMEDGRYRVSTPQGDVIANNVVMATGAEMIRPKGVEYDLVPNTNVKIQAIILATEPIPEELARELVPGNACFCNAGEATINHGRLIKADEKPGYYRLASGGAGALGKRHFEKLMRNVFPQLDREGIKIEKVWGGNLDVTHTSIPYIITPRPGFYATGGQSGQGMVNTTLYGGAIAEAIQGKPEKMEMLKILNPEFYASNPHLADWMNKALSWGAFAKEIVPAFCAEIKEEMAEKHLRKARRTGDSPEPL